MTSTSSTMAEVWPLPDNHQPGDPGHRLRERGMNAADVGEALATSSKLSHAIGRSIRQIREMEASDFGPGNELVVLAVSRAAAEILEQEVFEALSAPSDCCDDRGQMMGGLECLGADLAGGDVDADFPHELLEQGADFAGNVGLVGVLARFIDHLDRNFDGYVGSVFLQVRNELERLVDLPQKMVPFQRVILEAADEITGLLEFLSDQVKALCRGQRDGCERVRSDLQGVDLRRTEHTSTWSSPSLLTPVGLREKHGSVIGRDELAIALDVAAIGFHLVQELFYPLYEFHAVDDLVPEVNRPHGLPPSPLGVSRLKDGAVLVAVIPTLQKLGQLVGRISHGRRVVRPRRLVSGTGGAR